LICIPKNVEGIGSGGGLEAAAFAALLTPPKDDRIRKTPRRTAE
jgi:hypothetical protein